MFDEFDRELIDEFDEWDDYDDYDDEYDSYDGDDDYYHFVDHPEDWDLRDEDEPIY